MKLTILTLAEGELVSDFQIECPASKEEFNAEEFTEALESFLQDRAEAKRAAMGGSDNEESDVNGITVDTENDIEDALDDVEEAISEGEGPEAVIGQEVYYTMGGVAYRGIIDKVVKLSHANGFRVGDDAEGEWFGILRTPGSDRKVGFKVKLDDTDNFTPMAWDDYKEDWITRDEADRRHKEKYPNLYNKDDDVEEEVLEVEEVEEVIEVEEDGVCAHDWEDLEDGMQVCTHCGAEESIEEHIEEAIIKRLYDDAVTVKTNGDASELYVENLEQGSGFLRFTLLDKIYKISNVGDEAVATFDVAINEATHSITFNIIEKKSEFAATIEAGKL